MTYAEIAQASDRLAAALASIGVRRGDEPLLNWVNSFIYYHTLNKDLDKLMDQLAAAARRTS